jgi:hypothetical protein
MYGTPAVRLTFRAQIVLHGSPRDNPYILVWQWIRHFGYMTSPAVTFCVYPQFIR